MSGGWSVDRVENGVWQTVLALLVATVETDKEGHRVRGWPRRGPGRRREDETQEPLTYAKTGALSGLRHPLSL